VINIPFGYLDYAHGPAAESGHEPAQRLFELPSHSRKVEVDLGDEVLQEELRQVAELYADGKGEEYPRRHVGTARQIIEAIGSYREPED